MSTTEASLPELQEKFLSLEEAVNGELVEREPETRASVVALVAGQHVFFLGPPGIGKTLLIYRILLRIYGASFFKKLLTRFSVPEEVFGPQSLTALKDDRFERKINGYLPTAHIAFIDEIFKANSSILNSLLEAINERRYEHGTDVIDIPLSTLFSASNELAQDEGLSALYDRLLIRLEVKEIQDHDSFIKMLKTEFDPNPEAVLTWEDIELAKTEAAAVEIPDEVYEALATIQRELSEQGIRPTARRVHQSTSLIRAAAWLDGETVADLEHLRICEHVFWELPEQKNIVSGCVAKVASPLDAEALQLLDELMNLRKTCEQFTEKKASGEITELDHKRYAMSEFNKSQQFMETYDDLEKRSKSRRRPSEPMMKCHIQLRWITNFFMNVFDVEDAKGIKGMEKFE